MVTYKFLPLESIEILVDQYIQLDTRVQMRIRNGMTREIYLDHTILNEFINQNDPTLECGPFGIPTEDSLLRVAGLCVQQYGRTPEQLTDAFQRASGTEFLDQELREEIERRFKELLG